MKSSMKFKCKKEDIVYPYLGIADDSEGERFAVLFYGPGRGLVVSAEKNSVWAVGEHSNYWVEEDFILFRGTIKLSMT